MTAILVTGMSGVGKSSALAALAVRGYEVVDTDEGDWIRVVDGEPLWDENLVDPLLARERTKALFVQGTVANQARFYDRFDAIVLLSAPGEVIFQRLRTRTTNDFGKSAVEREQISRDIAEVEPLLRAGATHEIDATQPLADVVDALVAIAGD